MEIDKMGPEEYIKQLLMAFHYDVAGYQGCGS